MIEVPFPKGEEHAPRISLDRCAVYDDDDMTGEEEYCPLSELAAANAEMDSLKARVRELEEALADYGQHTIRCAFEFVKANGGFKDCDCGLAEALAAKPSDGEER